MADFMMNEITPSTVVSGSHFRPVQPPKIGGWLIVVAIGLVLSLFQNLSYMSTEIAPILRPGVWTRLTDTRSPVYDPYWKPVIIFDSASACFYVLANVIAILLFFGKRRLFPKLTVALIPTIFVLALVGYYLAGLIPAVANNPAHSLQEQALIVRFIALHVWVPYLLVSKRVRATFVL